MDWFYYDRRSNEQVEEQLENAFCMKGISIFNKGKNKRTLENQGFLYL